MHHNFNRDLIFWIYIYMIQFYLNVFNLLIFHYISSTNCLTSIMFPIRLLGIIFVLISIVVLCVIPLNLSFNLILTFSLNINVISLYYYTFSIHLIFHFFILYYHYCHYWLLIKNLIKNSSQLFIRFKLCLWSFLLSILLISFLNFYNLFPDLTTCTTQHALTHSLTSLLSQSILMSHDIRIYLIS